MRYNNRSIRGVLDTRVVRVLSIFPSSYASGEEEAQVVDIQTLTDFVVRFKSPSRVRPQVGDVWVLHDKLGSWNFDSLLRPQALPEARTLSEAVSLIQQLGLVTFAPEDVPDGEAIPTAGGAYVGEVRLFRGPTPAGWLNCDGSAVSRTYYWRLFATIGTTEGVGDGSTTFNLPTYSFTSPARYAICAH